ncbi:MAG: uncharacterized protein KVP18_000126 [Porospora cf. gigantea A]|uniref:uncharacterized protein n=1 Tax=Porospora cf. gigantea A TaxID=2853593 RepID=UPI00355A16E9|nr:MAG: hypothetical protein KVP18_000126 [Porospora cf. gigantea A]
MVSSDNTQPLLPQQVPPRVKQRLTLKGRLTSRLPQIDIPPPLLVVAAVITTLFNCGAPMNKIAAGIFWVRGGFYPCSGDCLHQIVAVADAVQTYVSMDLIVPAVGGVVLDHLGAKATAIIALLPMTISYFGYLPQAAPMGLQLPMILQGSFLQMVLNPLITLGFQFESASKMVISLVSGGCELAGLVFPAFNYIMEAYNVEYTSCVVFLIAQSVAALLFVTFFLPNEFEDTSDVELPAAPPPSLSKQVRSKPYLLFMAAWIITIVNMTTILSAVDSILLANGDVDGEIATFFANGLAFSFVGCVFFGNVLTVVGTGPVFVALQLCALTTNICALIPNMTAQRVLSVCFIAYKGSLFTVLFSFVTDNFGVGNMGTLVSICSVVSGAFTKVLGAALLNLAVEKGITRGIPDWTLIMYGFVVAQVLAVLLVIPLLRR